MRLLLKQDVENLGSVGEEVVVKNGYGRNYLIPTGKALLATPKNMKAFRHQKAIVQKNYEKFKGTAETLAQKIADFECVVTKKVGEQGKLFGSVTHQEINEILRAGGVEIDRRKIQTSEPIKSVGEHKVGIKLHAEVVAQLTVKVLAEKTEKTEEAPEAPEAKDGEAVEKDAGEEKNDKEDEKSEDN